MSTRWLATLALPVLLAGCALGERPQLQASTLPPSTTVAAGTPTGAASADRILARLEQEADQATFTATYEVTRRLGDITGSAVVVHRPGATAVTIAGWTFIRDGQDRTCEVSTSKCVPGILLQRMSNLVNRDDFWASQPAIQIRLALGQRSAPATFSVETVAGQASDCISISLGGGIEKYCVAAGGIETLTERNDLTLKLTAFSPTVDEKVFQRNER